MNSWAIFIIAAVLALTGSAQATDENVLFTGDFEVAGVDSVPEELMVLGGGFSVKETGGNKALELPGDPLEDFGALFGPAESDGIAVRARIYSESSKRLSPRFGVGLNGVAGYRLLVTPGQNRLQLLKDQQPVASAPFAWNSSTWTSLHLQIRKVSEGNWIIEGRAWADGTPEPKDWSISFEVSDPPPAGKASIWGAPYSGKPILFDDLRVISLQPLSKSGPQRPRPPGESFLRVVAARNPERPVFDLREDAGHSAPIETAFGSRLRTNAPHRRAMARPISSPSVLGRKLSLHFGCEI